MLRSERRFQRRRIIAKRLNIVKNCWRMDIESAWWKKVGRLNKWNLSCGCWMCRDEKYRDERQRMKQIEGFSDENISDIYIAVS